ncbi:hypothetical protein M9194_16205 [Vibrio sp. S4M6]|uniref:hypothetical protein n=1 Tax=Vibrio sinus TaxID=2946865 RepID=UPI00202A82CE|nr:hypothetical protein [Vibrio sinus]MCL9782973.1 hypothetical protein [Vibrio sinus]
MSSLVKLATQVSLLKRGKALNQLSLWMTFFGVLLMVMGNYLSLDNGVLRTFPRKAHSSCSGLKSSGTKTYVKGLRPSAEILVKIRHYPGFFFRLAQPSKIGVNVTTQR